MRLNGRGESEEYYINSVVCAGKVDGDGFFGRIYKRGIGKGEKRIRSELQLNGIP